MRTKRELAAFPKFLRIELEQREQDFNWFDLEYVGMNYGANEVLIAVYRITDCGPFQVWLWKDQLIDYSTVAEGCRPAIKRKEEKAEWKVLNYPVTKITNVRNY